ncbi:tRNA methyltransferase 2 [Rhizophlyctis rosea]|nr:tRNA methyltransferase 2 [Rhizophlyctis rosea]
MDTSPPSPQKRPAPSSDASEDDLHTAKKLRADEDIVAEPVPLPDEAPEKKAALAEDSPDTPRPQIMLNNIPLCGKKEIEKFCKRSGLEPVDIPKIKKGPKWRHCILVCRDEDHRDLVWNTLLGREWKHGPVELVRHNPVHTPRPPPVPKEVVANADNLTPEQRICNQVTPLWEMSYEEQLVKKQKKMYGLMKKLKDNMKNFGNANDKRRNGKGHGGAGKSAESSPAPQEADASEASDKVKREKNDLGYVPQAISDNNGLLCPLEKIIPSPQQDGYRNKCEFSFGKNFEGKATVGFLLGLFKEGKINVLEPTPCKNVSPEALKIAQVMQKFLREKAKLEVYDRVAKTGFWRQMQVRTLRSGEVSILVQYAPFDVDRKEVADDLERMRTAYNEARANHEVTITSFLIQEHQGNFNGIMSMDQAPTHLIQGFPWIHEELLGLKFRISPGAFFQVNTPGTEALYSLIRDWCAVGYTDSVNKAQEPEKTTKRQWRLLNWPLEWLSGKERALAEKLQGIKQEVKIEPGVVLDAETEDDTTITYPPDRPIIDILTNITGDDAPLKEGGDPRWEEMFETMLVRKRAFEAEREQAVADAKGSAGDVGVDVKGDIREKESNVVLLDLCCGTGTIGLSMAGNVKKVVGIEMVQAAVTDAKANAKLNGIENVSFYVGKLEDRIWDVLHDHVRGEEEVVAVLDPPRMGVDKKVVQTIRECPGIHRVIFVACDAEKSLQNFVDLLRPTSNKFKLGPFRLVRAQPVDMFPHTEHTELVLEFEREVVAPEVKEVKEGDV